MKLKFASALLALSSVTVSACGFTPVYGTAVDAEQGSIQITQIDGASGHVLRRELLMLLRPGLPGVEAGRLEIILDEDTTDFPFRPEGGNLRTTTESTAKYTLYTEKGMISGEVTGSSSFFSPSTPYADITARREAQSKAAMDLARKLATDLQLKTGRDDIWQPLP